MPTYTELITNRQKPLSAGELVSFPSVQGRDIYNPCVFKENGNLYMAARVESRESYWLDPLSYNPEIRFFVREHGRWLAAANAPIFNLGEDPFATWIDTPNGKRLIFGFVHLDRNIAPPTVVTKFFSSDSLFNLDKSEPFAEVIGMKDIRLLQLKDKRIAVCGRPTGNLAGKGRVSFTIINNYQELSSELVWNAPLIDSHLDPETKIGSNELYLLEDGRIGVIGHIAIGQMEVELHYAAASWIIDPQTAVSSLPKVLATRSDFPSSPSKLPWISDVVFSSSLVQNPDQTCTLYCGLSDAWTGQIIIANPF